MMKTILIDLDGVLNTYTDNYQADYISPIKEGAYDLLKKLSYEYDVKIFTTRNQDLTKEWLINNDRCITFSGDYEDLMNKIEKFR